MRTSSLGVCSNTKIGATLSICKAYILPIQSLWNDMNVLSLHATKQPLYFSTISCSYQPPKTPLFSAAAIPARDRIIDFGKFKGKMLGTLPSTYLKWVSKNLRARDYEEWAKLADEVLNDPVYKDRIEWEFAEKVLNGDVLTSPLLQEGNRGAVTELLEISERFGWDNEDKLAWSRIDFKLLGTSKGGRIPRVHDNLRVTKTASSRADVTRLRASQSYQLPSKKSEAGREVEGRRKERRERLRLTRSSSSSSSNGSPMKGAMKRMQKMSIENNEKGSFGIEEKVRFKGGQDSDNDRVVEVQSPFPGREALLKKVLNRPRF